MLYPLRLFFVFISLLVTAVPVAGKTLPQRLDTFVGLFVFEEAEDEYELTGIQANYPTMLIRPESMLPQTSKYPLKDIQLLYQFAKDCKGKLPLNPLVTDPLVFTRAMCRGTQLPQKWFARSGHVHPGGGTYAARYLQVYPERAQELERYMHISERELAPPNTLLGRLQLMSHDSIMAMLSGAPMFLRGDKFWLRKEDSYFVFDNKTLNQNAKQAELTFLPVAQTSECFYERGNICWQQQDNSDLLKKLMYLLVILNLLLIAGWAAYRWNSKRQDMKSRMLVLQILTHELRTPIASLSMTVEGFRREFEHLPESVYDEFRRLCEDTRRLRQLAEASKDYLQSDNQPLATEFLPSIREWLEYKIENYSKEVVLNLEQDLTANINIYWLGTCIDNLVNNAIKYGEGTVQLNVHQLKGNLIIEVEDEGLLCSHDWKQLRKPFVSKAGLGLGLTIVESMVSRMGGRLRLVGPPTKFIMEIPCGTDTSTC